MELNLSTWHLLHYTTEQKNWLWSHCRMLEFYTGVKCSNSTKRSCSDLQLQGSSSSFWSERNPNFNQQIPFRSLCQAQRNNFPVHSSQGTFVQLGPCCIFAGGALASPFQPHTGKDAGFGPCPFGHPLLSVSICLRDQTGSGGFISFQSALPMLD